MKKERKKAHLREKEQARNRNTKRKTTLTWKIERKEQIFVVLPVKF